MIFSLEVRRARKGDCLLLHFGTGEKPGLVLIDGGPSKVYGPHLKPRLTEIREARGLGPGKPLPVDMLMVSHVDDDHIKGILELTRELRETPQGQARMLRIMRLWHNSFDEIIGRDPRELTAALGNWQFGAAALTGDLPDDAALASGENDETVRDSLMVLAGIPQGHQLRGDAQALGIQLPRKLVMSGNKLKMGTVQFVVAGPMKAELKKLQDKHDKWLKEKKDEDAESALAAYADTSVPNLSSIVVYARSGDRTMLLTGDARGDRILRGLEQIKVIPRDGSLEVDVLKMPHHGSARNLEPDFFERIGARHYVFSGNGEHGNPDRESLEMLFAARGDKPFEIHLTYPVDEIDPAREADWKKEQAKEKKRGGKVREDWSHEKHSLRAFFAKTALRPNQKIRIVDAGNPHLIELGDPLGY
jgi:hypothetical protein